MCVIDRLMISRGFACGGEKGCFLPEESRLAALAALQQDQGYGSVFFVPQKAQPFRLQLVRGTAGAEFRQPFGAVYDEKVTAVLQRPRRRTEKGVHRATVIPPCQRQALTLRAGGKVGRVGNAAVEGTCGDKVADVVHIAAYTAHTGSKMIGIYIVHGGVVGRLTYLDAGNGAIRPIGAQKQSQTAAAGA